MAYMKFIRGMQAEIDKIEIVDGQLLFCTDTGAMYLDSTQNRTRITIPVDDSLDPTSSNPVQNSVLAATLGSNINQEGLADTVWGNIIKLSEDSKKLVNINETLKDDEGAFSSVQIWVGTSEEYKNIEHLNNVMYFVTDEDQDLASLIETNQKSIATLQSAIDISSSSENTIGEQVIQNKEKIKSIKEEELPSFIKSEPTYHQLYEIYKNQLPVSYTFPKKPGTYYTKGAICRRRRYEGKDSDGKNIFMLECYRGEIALNTFLFTDVSPNNDPEKYYIFSSVHEGGTTQSIKINNIEEKYNPRCDLLYEVEPFGLPIGEGTSEPVYKYRYVFYVSNNVLGRIDNNDYSFTKVYIYPGDFKGPNDNETLKLSYYNTEDPINSIGINQLYPTNFIVEWENPPLMMYDLNGDTTNIYRTTRFYNGKRLYQCLTKIDIETSSSGYFHAIKGNFTTGTITDEQKKENEYRIVEISPIQQECFGEYTLVDTYDILLRQTTNRIGKIRSNGWIEIRKLSENVSQAYTANILSTFYYPNEEDEYYWGLDEYYQMIITKGGTK